jgi:hypothetical protein
MLTLKGCMIGVGIWASLEDTYFPCLAIHDRSLHVHVRCILLDSDV